MLGLLPEGASPEGDSLPGIRDVLSEKEPCRDDWILSEPFREMGWGFVPKLERVYAAGKLASFPTSTTRQSAGQQEPVDGRVVST